MMRRFIISMSLGLLCVATASAQQPLSSNPYGEVVGQQHGHLFPQPPRVAVQPPTAGATQKYLILQPAAQGYGQGVHPAPYAYGWFGAASRGQYGYGRGYYDDVRLWKPW